MKLGLILIALFASQSALAQPPSATPAPAEFEAVSIKPYAPAGPPYEACNPHFDAVTLGYAGCTLKNLIKLAYGLKDYQVPDKGPAWTETDRYMIQARASRPTPRPELVRMLQSILADRFHLNVHWEDREGSVYLLKVSGKGTKLTPATDKSQCGAVTVRPEGMWSDCQSIADIAETLEGVIRGRRPVINDTSLPPENQYAYRIMFSLSDDPDMGPSIFSALPEQSGLTLTAARAPVHVLVLDRVQRPDPN